MPTGCDCGADTQTSARFGRSHLPWCATKKGPAPASGVRTPHTHPEFDEHFIKQGRRFVSDEYAHGLTKHLERLRAALRAASTGAEPSFDPSNHHNALRCPYCNPDKLELHAATGAEKEKA